MRNLLYALLLAGITCNAASAQDESVFDLYEGKHHMPYTQPEILFTGFLNLGYEFWTTDGSKSFAVLGARSKGANISRLQAEFRLHPEGLNWTADWPLSFTTLSNVCTGIPIGIHSKTVFDGSNASYTVAGVHSGVEVHFLPGIVLRSLVYVGYAADLQNTANFSAFDFTINGQLGYRF